MGVQLARGFGRNSWTQQLAGRGWLLLASITGNGTLPDAAELLERRGGQDYSVYP
jgi:hypothetical protein